MGQILRSGDVYIGTYVYLFMYDLYELGHVGKNYNFKSLSNYVDHNVNGD